MGGGGKGDVGCGGGGGGVRGVGKGVLGAWRGGAREVRLERDVSAHYGADGYTNK